MTIRKNPTNPPASLIAKPKPETTCIDLSALAESLGLPMDYLAQLCIAKEIPYLEIDGRAYFEESEVARHLREIAKRSVVK